MCGQHELGERIEHGVGLGGVETVAQFKSFDLRPYAQREFERIAPAMVEVSIVGPKQTSCQKIVTSGIDITIILTVPLKVEGKNACVEGVWGVRLDGVEAHNGVVGFDGAVVGGDGVAAFVESPCGIASDGVEYCFLDFSIPFKLADGVERLVRIEGEVACDAATIGEIDRDARGAANTLADIDIIIADSTIFVERHSLPDSTSIKLVAGITRVVVGVEIKQVVGGTIVGEDTFRTVEVIVEGVVPSGGDVLGVGYMQLVVFVERAVVRQQCERMLYLIEGYVVGRFIKTRKSVGTEIESERAIKILIDGQMGMSHFSGIEVIIAIEAVDTVVELCACGREAGMIEIHYLHIEGKMLEREHRSLQHTVGSLHMVFDAFGGVVLKSVVILFIRRIYA